ncbi:4-alpha-glucanotransferase [Candidatus Omnitrophota bacterium]
MSKTSFEDYLLKCASGDKWKRISACRRQGALAPLFSVYSRQSIGIGDFADLRLLIDWVAGCGNSILQLLPLNEMGSTFSPYESISSFALEPAYISLRELEGVDRELFKKGMEDLSRKFPAGGKYVDFGIKKEKVDLLRKIYRDAGSSRSKGQDKFERENAYWLNDFALYKVLREEHNRKHWEEWEQEYKKRDKSALEAFEDDHVQETGFYKWLQWQLYLQFCRVKAHAASREVLLKGDLPFLAARDSADVWARRELFQLEFALGAAPDLGCAKGQRWGMPPYDQERLAEEDYSFLKQGLKYAENFYDIVRIDHVVGFFRSWNIPYAQSQDDAGLNGVYEPAEEADWERQGRKILKVMLESTDMLFCGEDLGAVPKVCLEVLRELGIPGYDVQRWLKDYFVAHDFVKPRHYRKLTVATLSLHDSTNWPAWWENDAGAVVEDVFTGKCEAHGIDYKAVKEKLFDLALSRHGRLRWLKSLDSVKKLLSIIGKVKEEAEEIVFLYENSFAEKEKLWKRLKIAGKMREACDPEIMGAALNLILEAPSVFCINTIIDLLYLGGVFKGDVYQYRINTPGTYNEKNWSMVIPLPLEKLPLKKG